MHSLLILATLALLFTRTTTALGDITSWVRFCDDDDCSENCGTWVAVTNPGCLAQHGRRSLFHKGQDTMVYPYALVVSPPGDSSCSCQWHCVTGFGGSLDECHTLGEFQKGDSYRFIRGGCPDPDCPGMEAAEDRMEALHEFVQRWNQDIMDGQDPREDEELLQFWVDKIKLDGTEKDIFEVDWGHMTTEELLGVNVGQFVDSVG
jgi:hypothetical protein